MRYVLDTHVWLWARLAPERLSESAKDVLAAQRPADELLLSAISPWEFGMLLRKGRIEVSCSGEEWMNRALQMPRLRLVPLTPAIAYRSHVLPDDFRSDPADQIIAATAREENATLITKDRRLLEYSHVKTLW